MEASCRQDFAFVGRVFWFLAVGRQTDSDATGGGGRDVKPIGDLTMIRETKPVTGLVTLPTKRTHGQTGMLMFQGPRADARSISRR